jgi:hypothetical protein
MKITNAPPDQNQMPHMQVNEQHPLQCTTILIAFNLSLLLLEQGNLLLSLPLHNFSCLWPQYATLPSLQKQDTHHQTNY